MMTGNKNKELLYQFVLAFLVFAFSQLVLGILLKFMDLDYFDRLSWIRWDSAHYLGIAEKGYEFFPCAGKFGYPSDAKDMCGNTAWFPGYAMVLRFFGLFFKDLILVGGIVSKVFYFLTLFMILRVAGIERITFKNFLFLSIAAFSFGSIYYNAIFPISGLLFCVITAFYFYQKQKIGLTALFCFFASFFYTTGFLLTAVFGLYSLIRPKLPFKQKLREVLIIGLSGLLGFLAVFALIQWYVHDWTAFMQVQAKYGNGTLHNPFVSMTAYIKKGFHTFSLENFKYYQTLLVAITYFFVTVFFLVKGFYKTPLYLLSFLYVTVFLFFPWVMGGDVSFYRAEALLLPYVFLLRDLKTSWLSFILIVLITLSVMMSRLFFLNILV